jgi:hypothetical protein
VRTLQQEGVRPMREIIKEDKQNKKNCYMQGLLVGHEEEGGIQGAVAIF